LGGYGRSRNNFQKEGFMIDTINDRIKRFENYYSEQLTEITELKGMGGHTNHYRRILLITILDAMSKAVFPNVGNRQRNVNLLRNYSEWKELDRVSLPHLQKILQMAPEPQFEPLRLFAAKELSKWLSGEVVTLDRDASFQDVITLWPKDSESKYPIRGISKEITIESIQHVHIFYSHRNYLLHEFRMPGMLSSELCVREKEPTYCQLMHESDDEENEVSSWELMYPIGFYSILVENSLKNLSAYLRKNQIDPIASYSSGSFWIDELNN
jgi:hypothetical protein